MIFALILAAQVATSTTDRDLTPFETQLAQDLDEAVTELEKCKLDVKNYKGKASRTEILIRPSEPCPECTQDDEDILIIVLGVLAAVLIPSAFAAGFVLGHQ